MDFSQGRATARVVARAPLLRGGLESAARSAGLLVVHGNAPAIITLRSIDQDPAGTGVDIAAEVGSVTITVNAVPERGTWLRILTLLDELMDPTG